MMKKYNITDDGFGDTYTFRFDNNCLPLKCGWWIVAVCLMVLAIALIMLGGTCWIAFFM